MQLRTVTECCDAVGKLRQLFSFKFATVRSVAVTNKYGSLHKHDKRCLCSTTNLRTKKLMQPNIRVHREYIQPSILLFKESKCFVQNSSQAHAPFFSHAAFCPRRNCLMTAASNAPLSETIGFLHEWNNCLSENPQLDILPRLFQNFWFRVVECSQKALLLNKRR